MRPPLSSQARITLLNPAAHPERQPLNRLPFAPVRDTFGRQSSCLQNAPYLGELCPYVWQLSEHCCQSVFWSFPVKQPTVALPTGGFDQVQAHASDGSWPAYDGLRRPSIRVGSHLSPCGGAGRNTTICIRPLAIRRSLVPGRPFSSTVALRHTRNFLIARTSPRRDVAVVSPLFRAVVLPSTYAKLACLGKRSRLCRRATGEEYPGRRRTKVPAPGAITTGAALSCRVSGAVRFGRQPLRLARVTFVRQSTSRAPAGISPCSR